MGSAWQRDETAKTGRQTSGFGRPLFANARPQVELLEDRLAPSTSPVPTPSHGTMPVDPAVSQQGIIAEPVTGIIVNILGPVQSALIQQLPTSQAIIPNMSVILPQSPRSMDPGGGGFYDVGAALASPAANPFAQTSNWQLIPDELANSQADDAWLIEIHRTKVQTQATPETTEPESSPAPADATGPQPKTDCPDDSSADEVNSQASAIVNPVREELVCRVIMQARPGYLVALFLLLSWASREFDHRERAPAGRYGSRWPRKYDPNATLTPSQRPRAARAPPDAWNGSRNEKGQAARSALFRCLSPTRKASAEHRRKRTTRHFLFFGQ